MEGGGGVRHIYITTLASTKEEEAQRVSRYFINYLETSMQFLDKESMMVIKVCQIEVHSQLEKNLLLQVY